MADDVHVKVAGVVKDLENLKERCKEIWDEFKSSNKENLSELRELHDNIADLYNQVEHIKEDVERDYKAISKSIDEIKSDVTSIRERGCSKYKEVHEASLIGRIVDEIRESRLWPLFKIFIVGVLALLAVHGVIPKGWIPW